MTTLGAVAREKAEASAEQLAAAELVRMAKEQGLSLTGPNGLLKQFTKTVQVRGRGVSGAVTGDPVMGQAVSAAGVVSSCSSASVVVVERDRARTSSPR